MALSNNPSSADNQQEICIQQINSSAYQATDIKYVGHAINKLGAQLEIALRTYAAENPPSGVSPRLHEDAQQRAIDKMADVQEISKQLLGLQMQLSSLINYVCGDM